MPSDEAEFLCVNIHVDGLTVDQMNRSVPEFVSQYYIVNKKATEQEKKDAEDFLLWLNTSETGLVTL